MLHFGAGNRMCLGRNISAREIYKLVPALLRTFKVFPFPRGSQAAAMDHMLGCGVVCSRTNRRKSDLANPGEGLDTYQQT